MVEKKKNMQTQPHVSKLLVMLQMEQRIGPAYMSTTTSTIPPCNNIEWALSCSVLRGTSHGTYRVQMHNRHQGQPTHVGTPVLPVYLSDRFDCFHQGGKKPEVMHWSVQHRSCTNEVGKTLDFQDLLTSSGTRCSPEVTAATQLNSHCPKGKKRDMTGPKNPTNLK